MHYKEEPEEDLQDWSCSKPWRGPEKQQRRQQNYLRKTRRGKYVSEEKEVKTPEEALQGAQDIIAEMISDDADHRLYIRNITVEEGIVTGTAKDEKAQSVYEMYYNFEEPVKKIAGHRVLALNRGEAEKVLTVKVNAPEEYIVDYLEKKLIREGKGNRRAVEGTGSSGTVCDHVNEAGASYLRRAAGDRRVS